MQYFEYLALNAETQQLRGVIPSETEVDAKRQLNGMGLAVISIQVATPEAIEASQKAQEESGLKKYEFHVIDSKGAQIKGTIDAPDRKTVFKRLVSEYSFEVVSICDLMTPELDRFEEGQKGMKELEEEVEIEFGVKMKRAGDEEKKEDFLGDSYRKEKEILIREIDMVMKKTDEVLNKNKDRIPPKEIDELTKLMGDIMRLKLSNNLGLIRKLSEDLLGTLEEVIKVHLTKKDPLLNPQTGEMMYDDEDDEEIDNSEAYVNLLGSLKRLSGRLDSLLGSRKKTRKKGSFLEKIFGKKSVSEEEDEEREEFILTVVFGSASLFIKALTTPNKDLRDARMKEAMRPFKEWSRKRKRRKKMEEKKRLARQAEIKKRIEEQKQVHGESGAESIEFSFDMLMFEGDFLSLIFNEIRLFFIILLFLFFSFFIFLRVFTTFDFLSISHSLNQILFSPTLHLFVALSFLVYFFATIRQKFFMGNTPKSVGLIIVMIFSLVFVVANF